MELWLLHVSTPAKYAHFDNKNVSQKLESNNEPFSCRLQTGENPSKPKATASVDFDLAGTSTKVNVHTDKSVDMHTNVQIAQGTIPSSSVITNNSYLYSLGSSPICVHEVEKSLSFYPFGNVKTELIQGLNHGFKLQYNGPRLPVQSKNSRSVSENPDLVREKIFKEIDLGRVAGPFDYPPMPTFRVSPIFLVRKKNGDFSWSKSDGETLSNRNALLMSVFANFPLLPILLIMSMASSMPEYLTVQNSGSMKSLTEYWVGYERLWISRKSPFFFLREKLEIP
jgi:hypothetical protein